jgi:hypothetical protein
MNVSEVALLLAGHFFGGTIDHIILALKRSELTPYGIRSEVRGNWGLAGLDLVIASAG